MTVRHQMPLPVLNLEIGRQIEKQPIFTHSLRDAPLEETFLWRKKKKFH